METTVHTGIISDEVDAEVSRVVEHIVKEVQPLRIILFGSRAKGTARPDSDVDLLVVMPEGTDRRAAMREIGSRIPRRTVGLDLLVATPAVLERNRNVLGLIYREILRTGRTVYVSH